MLSLWHHVTRLSFLEAEPPAPIFAPGYCFFFFNLLLSCFLAAIGTSCFFFFFRFFFILGRCFRAFGGFGCGEGGGLKDGNGQTVHHGPDPNSKIHMTSHIGLNWTWTV